MCGILTAWTRDGKPPLERAVVERACDTMIHRGPDDSGVESFLDGSLWLAHRRLAILDLSRAGRQPMASKDGRYQISYNGEIYNYREIRKRLIGLGHPFISDSDTEVLLAAYAEWGLDSLSLFNGMWAFVIFDQARQELICCRDRFGMKPLYYYDSPRGFAAASEIRAILALGWLTPSMNRCATAQFLLTGLTDGLEATCFEDIYRIPAGHYLRLRDGRREIVRYWQLPPSEAKRSVLNEDTMDQFLNLFASSVRHHLVSDVPLGTCLSGGLDSASIACVSARQIPDRVKTFSSFFEFPECDERLFAFEVIRRCRARARFIRPKWEDVPTVLPEILWHLEEPCKSLGVYAEWHVMKLASEQVTVLLNGQGGDETLAGYDFYFPLRAKGLLRQARVFTHWKEGRASQKFPSVFDSLKELLRQQNGRHEAPSAWPDWLSQSLRHEDLFHSTACSRRYPYDLVNDRLASDLERDMLPAFLRYEDKMGMAFSIEARFPFLDYRLVEFLFSRTSDIKLCDGWTKYILRRALNGILPDSVCWRRDKLGFPTPFRSWFRNELYSWVSDLLGSQRLKEADLIEINAARRLLQRHREAKVNAENRIWRWVVTILWLEQLDQLTNLSGGRDGHAQRIS